MFVKQSTNALIGQECGVDARSNKVKLACAHQKNPRTASTIIRERIFAGKPSILTRENGKGIRLGSIGSGSRIRVFRTRKRIILIINKGEHDDV
jgi:hypothetical protein